MSAAPKNNGGEVQAGTDIPAPDVGKVADWLFNKSNFLLQVVAAAVSWLNLSVIVNVKLPDGTQTSVRVRPVITAKNSTLTIPVDLSGFTGQGGGGAGGVVYFRACLEDGTTCYVPVPVAGTIYRNPGSGTVTPVINSGSVPAGANELV